jgi:hypothetical protein
MIHEVLARASRQEEKGQPDWKGSKTIYIHRWFAESPLREIQIQNDFKILYAEAIKLLEVEIKISLKKITFKNKIFMNK